MKFSFSLLTGPALALGALLLLAPLRIPSQKLVPGLRKISGVDAQNSAGDSNSYHLIQESVAEEPGLRTPLKESLEISPAEGSHEDRSHLILL